ncbi:chromosome segregation protein Csm1/Pcs1-domain-containing protein [Piptocephalis cylindrospora]|uniref:Chromosome segregation protein Csm1/Pcs1-domain-containing protein n=1 Tax=Piptocephalis cylindrospora TaxID=1907219 RepID=A0A4P9Y2N2_9FUNG|nr:chromosome segregation protein Csm1/Pcs1-domain-containing protein [Piptocephalis cylindrospora]|eukprot:RKP12321.1 chromosome segregation protein Csm1/Pcs1-domain-containing protein [Piptocephalis cylindrospora]
MTRKQSKKPTKKKGQGVTHSAHGEDEFSDTELQDLQKGAGVVSKKLVKQISKTDGEESLVEKTSRPVHKSAKRKEPSKPPQPPSESDGDEPKMDPYINAAQSTPLTKRSRATRKPPKEKHFSPRDVPVQISENLMLTEDDEQSEKPPRSGVSKAYDLLLAKYEELRTMRLTDAEGQFQAYRKSVEERFAATDVLIETLKGQLEEARASPSSSSSSSQINTAPSSDSDISLMEAQLVEANARARTPGKQRPSGAPDGPILRDLGEVVGLFEELTGLEVTRSQSPEGSHFDCVQTGKNGVLSFRLTRPTEDPTLFDYTPDLDAKRDAKLLETLPGYLQDEIRFQRRLVVYTTLQCSSGR